MSYNRTLDLLAVSLAATVAGMPVKAAKFMAEAAKDVDGANTAIEAIYAANKKAKPKAKKKKAKAGFDTIFAGMEDDELPGDDEQVEEVASEDDENVSDEEVMHLEESMPATETAKRLRAALEGGAEAVGSDEESEESDDEEDKAQEAKVQARMKARRAAKAAADGAGVENEAAGEEEREEPQVSRETSRFAKTLRNLAARQNSK